MRIRRRLSISRRKLVRRGLGVLCLMLAISAIPGSGRTGIALPLTGGLRALVVSIGYHSVLSEKLESYGLSAAVGSVRDQSVSSANAYGAVLELKTGRAPEGLLVLDVVEDSVAHKAGLRNGDIVSYVGVGGRCKPLLRTLQSSWVTNSRCATKVTVHRADGIETLWFPRGALRSVTTNRVRSFVVPDLPLSMGAVSGTSMGLAVALLFLEDETGGGLFSADEVAATGTLASGDLSVDAISALQYKAKAAYEAGTTLLFVPFGQAREVPFYSGMAVVEVSKLADAVEVLCARGAESDACRLVEGKPRIRR